MEERIEILMHIYQDAEMAIFNLEELLKEIKEKDNKIKIKMEEILSEYEEYFINAREELFELGCELEKNNIINKITNKMNIKKDVKNDNSDASIAAMLIKEISIGSVDMEKKIKAYSESGDTKAMHLAKEFKKFQEFTIEDLKEFM